LICSVQPRGKWQGPGAAQAYKAQMLAVVLISVHQKDLALSGVRPLS